MNSNDNNELRQKRPEKKEVKFVLIPGSGGKETVGTLKGDPLKGEIIYKKYCVYCHGKKGYGDGMAAIALKPSPAVLNNSFMGWKRLGNEEYKKLEQRLFEIITYGSKGSPELNMPAWGPVISREDRVHVLSYIKMVLTEKEEDE